MPADPDVYSYLTGEASGASNGLTLGELDADSKSNLPSSC